MQTDIYQVDAFTDKTFGGNPAAVCPLDTWLPDEILQNIAMENNLSETAFFIPSKIENIDYDLRWFMPEGEVDLCGHATMAAAFIIFNHMDFPKDAIHFSSRSGTLTVKKRNDDLCMDFPIWHVEEHTEKQELTDASGISPTAIFKGHYWMAIFESEDDITSMTPDFSQLQQINDIDFLIVTASSKDKNIDFVSRFFCPKLGVNEDPVTGSAHCVTAPYWENHLNKNILNAYQASKRGGQVRCEVGDKRVEITGQATLYMKGQIYV